MKIYRALHTGNWDTLIRRPEIDSQDIRPQVTKLLQQVKDNGDQAIYELTRQFDGVLLDSMLVGPQEMQAVDAVDEPLKAAIIQAKDNITAFHQEQAEQTAIIETMPGVQCWRRSVAIQRVGLYVPGGSAPLFSTVLMLGVPAMLAGCEQIQLCTPPRKDGTIHPAILFAAKLVGITQIYKIGGIQAIGALAYGTKTVAKVDKIFGPGNRFVTMAKQIVSQQGVAIDIPAGPSEVLILADSAANPQFIAADLLAQAEHGPDSQCILITDSALLLDQVYQAVEGQAKKATRTEQIEKALQNCRLILAGDHQQAIDFSNAYAPEHLIIMSRDPHADSLKIYNAGSVFLGDYTPVAAGDYASGTNHTLPTNGWATTHSGVSLDSFVKKITFQSITPGGLALIGPVIQKMAQAEQLDAHSDAVSIRLDHIQ
ncbi:MAG: histidinol dehydrogenase [Dyadobacter sp. 50-39]|uniref:histidinol dehydrogenase n=1 Tax=Dyadobacter sp. 50-39 TaxID=1895756 RepID=UPI00095AF101|nr:histidinol dehydrogenase [Dyadobacter sp. 50-39]OJV19138.1 MAG: histidinol dehydrogenase [Dyadobacter sp. 50-39]